MSFKFCLPSVEWFIPLATGVKGRPTLFGQGCEGPMAGHESPRKVPHN